MVFPYAIKYNGEYYEAGEEIEEGGNQALPSDDLEDFEEETDERQYTKTEINRLNKEQLIALATENGIENASEMSGNELKSRLIEMLVTE